MTYRLLPEAVRDVETIVETIADENPSAAQN
ncbi:MAG: hypothetical protein RLZZ157_753, partial [Pseudomonadota bacterium]|jgi:plasmid stabilization system protein ParE